MVNQIGKALTLSVILLFVGISVHPCNAVGQNSPIPLSNGNTLYVGGTGEGNYTKIQDAINDASDGDTVFVYNGIYYENIVVNHSIKLIGEDRFLTIIDGNHSGDVVYVTENVNGGTIKGFTIQNSGDDPWDDAGIDICGHFDRVTDNVIINNDFGIKFFPEDNLYAYFKEISHNIITNNEKGMWIVKGLENVTSTDIFENYITKNSVGIHTWRWHEYEEYDNIRINIYHNNITNNNHGIYIEIETDNNVFKNNISENKNGIVLVGEHGFCYENKIYQNNIVKNIDGIVLFGTCGGNIYNNDIYLNNIEENYRGIILCDSYVGICPIANNIYQNNFINNTLSATIQLENRIIFRRNKWSGNYWDGPRILPKIISGYYYIFPLFNIDWHPAKEPYEIGV